MTCNDLGDSKVTILDEPTSGVDVSARHLIWKVNQFLPFYLCSRFCLACVSFYTSVDVGKKSEEVFHVGMLLADYLTFLKLWRMY